MKEKMGGRKQKLTHQARASVKQTSKQKARLSRLRATTPLAGAASASLVGSARAVASELEGTHPSRTGRSPHLRPALSLSFPLHRCCYHRQDADRARSPGCRVIHPSTMRSQGSCPREPSPRPSSSGSRLRRRYRPRPPPPPP